MTSPGTLKGFQISDNLIKNSGHDGIQVTLDRECGATYFQINGNSINASTSIAINVVAGSNCLLGGIAGFDVQDNRIWGSGTGNISIGATGAGGTSAANLTDVKVSDNIVDCVSAANGIAINSFPGYLRNIQVTNNSIKSDGTMLVGVSVTQNAGALGNDNIQINGNQVYNVATIGILLNIAGNLKVFSMTDNLVNLLGAGTCVDAQVAGTFDFGTFVANAVSKGGGGTALARTWGVAPGTCVCTGNTSNGGLGESWGTTGAGYFCLGFGVGINNVN